MKKMMLVLLMLSGNVYAQCSLEKTMGFISDPRFTGVFITQTPDVGYASTDGSVVVEGQTVELTFYLRQIVADTGTFKITMTTVNDSLGQALSRLKLGSGDNVWSIMQKLNGFASQPECNLYRIQWTITGGIPGLKTGPLLVKMEYADHAGAAVPFMIPLVSAHINAKDYKFVSYGDSDYELEGGNAFISKVLYIEKKTGVPVKAVDPKAVAH